MKSGISNSILDAIGNTPMLQVEGIYCKLEYLNPSGSIKARVAKYMVERAENEGLLRPGDTIVEATSGNTGNALSMVAAVKGYRMLVELPEGVVPDALVMGVGRGGTLIGVGQAFREVNPRVKLFAMEPSESSTIMCGEVGDHLIEGIADGFVPGIFQRHRDLVDTALTVDSEEAVEEMRRLARKCGLFVGPSSGANLIATRKVRGAYPELETIITLFCDEGEKYISDHFAERDSVRVGREAYK